MLVFFAVLPWFQFAGAWDRYLSFHLYSGDAPRMYICSSAPAVKPGGSASFQQDLSAGCGNQINVQSWAMRVLHCPVYPEDRVYRSIARYRRSKYPGEGSRFYVESPGFVKRRRELR
ncbi:MAG: hypothetical protein EOP51_13835 [Sphingobacteriales bacterium]|nr:MAG: hypothetical protein EOP51_13835 [Sphingobacteriales bacterium]